MKNKILQLIVFCCAITLLMFLPAIFTFASDMYLDITMSNKGKLPTVDTYKKLEQLIESKNKESYNFDIGIPDFSFQRRYINDNIAVTIDDVVFSQPDLSNAEDFGISNVTSSKNASEYSGTNVQVAGVDEADILKNDWKYIYSIADGKLVIVEAFPADELKKLSEIKLEDGYRAIDLYISGDKLFLVTDNNDYRNSETKILIYDIKDRALPQEIKTFEFIGNYSSSRKIGEKVYVFSNLEVTRNGGRYIVPQYRDNDTLSFSNVELTDIQYIPNDEYSSYTQILAFDLTLPLNTPKISTYLGAGANNLYMSLNNLYMAQNKYGETILYKFSLENTCLRYKCKGKVPGYIVNQFAMDEYDGNFRIATTKNNRNAVYILSESMHKLGSITNMAPGETIKSVRFEGTRGYVVTFRNTDPLFVIDLSQVRAPKLLGELKIPGYSTYLHTYDENHVIGFGYDGTEWGTNGKLKVALFDITDVEYPVEKYCEKIDANTSELLTNHKSLLFSKEKNLIAFSAGDYNYSWNEKTNKSKVGKVYTITLDEGFKLRGDINHEDDVNRMLFMDDVLYGVSNKTVSAHDIDSIELINKIEL